MSKPITFNRIYAHPPKKVWAAITEAKAVSQWLMPCDIKAKVGHRFQFRDQPRPGFDGIVNCEVLEAEPQRKLVYSWSGGGLKNTIVSFELRPVDGGTELKFEHHGFQGLFNRIFVKRLLAAGWRGKLLSIQLPQYLSNHG